MTARILRRLREPTWARPEPPYRNTCQPFANLLPEAVRISAGLNRREFISNSRSPLQHQQNIGGPPYCERGSTGHARPLYHSPPLELSAVVARSTLIRGFILESSYFQRLHAIFAGQGIPSCTYSVIVIEKRPASHFRD